MGNIRCGGADRWGRRDHPKRQGSRVECPARVL